MGQLRDTRGFAALAEPLGCDLTETRTPPAPGFDPARCAPPMVFATLPDI